VIHVLSSQRKTGDIVENQAKKGGKMTNIDLTEKQESRLFILGIYPKCPFYKPVPVLIVLVLITLGTWGISYLNFWAAFAYLLFSLLFYFLVMPFTMCKYCYFRITESSIDEEHGRTIKKLLSIDRWREVYLSKHAGQGPWTALMSIIWLLPVVLIIVSFIVDFSLIALVSLIGFIAVLVGNFYYMLLVKCPSCAIKEECHSVFGKQKL